MLEFIIIVEGPADARIATHLVERILVEKIEWLEPESIQYQFVWSGLLENTNHSCWKDIKQIINQLQLRSGIRLPKYLGHGKAGSLKADGAAASKILTLSKLLQRTRQVKAVFLLRDLDNQLERRQGLEQARLEHADRKTELEIVVGTADPKREAWVLNGFIPNNSTEEKAVKDI
ncbi:MAG: hypothetical protein AAFW75_24165, partial [Cyanobacteria bacterium J06636_16]